MVSSESKRAIRLKRIDDILEAPMLIASFVWAWLLIEELRYSLSPFEENLGICIWALFIAEYVLKLFLAPEKLKYLGNHIVEALALLVPAVRILRIARLFRILTASRFVTSSRILGAIFSSSRLKNEVMDFEGETPEAEVNVGVVFFSSDAGLDEELVGLAQRSLAKVNREMESSTNLPWKFHLHEPQSLASSASKRPSEFLDEASLTMVEGPFDIVLVFTDVGIYSRENRREVGQVSVIGRVSVLSLRQLLLTKRGKASHNFNEREVETNCAALVLQHLGRMAGLKMSQNSTMMTPFRFRTELVEVPKFNQSERAYLKGFSDGFPEREYDNQGIVGSLMFHIIMASKHPKLVAKGLWRNRSLFLSLTLPSLATAAVAPAIILVFTAEIWDVGLGMSPQVAVLFSLTILILATLYLTQIKSLFFPRRDKRIITEHLAVANSLVFLSVLVALVGLFLMVLFIIMLIQIYVFPPDLIATWPTLNHKSVTTADLVRLAAFISSIGLATGALAGGLESRTVIRNLALFEDEY